MTSEPAIKTIYLASCIDDDYAMPFAVMVKSVMATLNKGTCVEWFILNAGVSEENVSKIFSSVEDERLRLCWLFLKEDRFKGVMPRAHVSMAAYQKVLLFDLIPSSVKKVVYLDADIVVCHDIAELWSKSLHGKVLGAVQDQSIPFHDSRKALRNFYLAAPFLESPTGVENYAVFGIDPEAKYFNSGVMIVDLDIWRSEGIEGRIVEFLNKNKRHNRYFDQDGFNAILWDQWHELDPRWNQIAYVLRYPSWERSPFDKETFDKIKNDPFVVHFVAYDKPWHWGSKHLFRQKFFEYLERTTWGRWKPSFWVTKWKIFTFHMKNVRFSCRRYLSFFDVNK